MQKNIMENKENVTSLQQYLKTCKLYLEEKIAIIKFPD